MKVSILISNYNYAYYLPEAVKSVLDQTHQDIEIIIVDDGSTDQSRDLITKLQQQVPDTIKPIFQQNQGQGAAFNTGFAASSGEIVAFLDADDSWKPNKLQRVVEMFSEPEIIGVMHPLELIDAESQVISTGAMAKPMPSGDIARIITATGNAWWFPPTSGLTYRRRALDQVLPMDIAKWHLCADGCLVYCTSFLGKVTALNEVLGSYRLHGANNYFSHQPPGIEKRLKSLAGIEMTNRYLNDFLKSINYPDPVDLSRNLSYRRERYYLRGQWDIQEVNEISSLILSWPFYSWQEKMNYLVRFWLKSVGFWIHPTATLGKTMP